MNAAYNSLGIYSLAEAARLVGASTPSLNRWLYGHDYVVKKDELSIKKHAPALWSPQYEATEWGEKVIGFRDLLELRVVREFIQHGVPLSVIRRCFENAKQMYGVDYPLTTCRFATDGQTIFKDIVLHSTDEEMIDLHKRQFVFRDIIKPSLYQGIEYNTANDHARRWFPNGKKHDIVIDPERQFGKPIVAESGVPTNIIYVSFQTEGSDKAAAARTAKIFEIPAKNVESAIRFEEQLRKAA